MTNTKLIAKSLPGHKIKQKISRDDLQMRLFMGVIALYLLVAVAFPLYAILSKSLDNREGAFVGLENYIYYFSTPALFISIYNSLFVAIFTTVVTVSLAFTFAFALTRSCMVGKGIFKTIAMIPILIPSLLAGIALVYLFGNQGIIKSALFGHSIYGPIGIIIAETFYTFPHALLIIMTAFSIADARMYEAAISLRASPLKIFLV